MTKTEKRLEEIYNHFKKVTNPRLVKSFGDAFTLLAFEIVFRQFHSIRELDIDDRDVLALLEKSIVIAPDDGIDIVYQEESLGDEPKFHIVQCKSSSLPPEAIRECFLKMRDSLEGYVAGRDCKRNLKRVLVDNEFAKDSLANCTFYVVHQGSEDRIPRQRDNESIITAETLENYAELLIAQAVPYERFKSDSFNNFIVNNYVNQPDAEINPHVPKSILCNLSGYDLALLDRRYSKSELGRNILYGGNLRDSLGKRSKAFTKMLATVKEEPELFLYYNNGVTIITESFDRDEEDALILKKFSIINGAQTTSTLGAFLAEAEDENDVVAIEKLKKVLVLTKIYEVNPKTPKQKAISERIRIYSNTQTPLSSRDMVAINPEQQRIQERFFNGTPQLFINIKSGQEMPKPSRVPAHGQITNEALAQLALCGYYFDPNSALAKKVQIFEPSSKKADQQILNETYDKLFSPDRGVLFKKSSYELDELLFVRRLHDDTKRLQKKNLNDQIDSLSQRPLVDGMTDGQRRESVNWTKRSLEIAQKCLFFNIAAYFKLRLRFDPYCPEISSVAFDTFQYYDDKKGYGGKLIRSFNDLIFSRTMKIIQDNSEGENLYTWLRRDETQDLFFAKLNQDFDRDIGLGDTYRTFVRDFKTIKI